MRLLLDTHVLLWALTASARLNKGAHAACVAQLPLLHQDPFDRLLVAQAMIEPLRLLTADAALVPYSELVQLV